MNYQTCWPMLMSIVRNFTQCLGEKIKLWIFFVGDDKIDIDGVTTIINYLAKNDPPVNVIYDEPGSRNLFLFPASRVNIFFFLGK